MSILGAGAVAEGRRPSPDERGTCVSESRPETDPLAALYREVVLDHFRSPRNRAPLSQPSGSGRALNPVCGDEVRVEVSLRAGCIADSSARAQGCSIAVAAASVLTELVAGLAPEAALQLGDRLAALVHGAGSEAGLDERLRAFAPVARLPSRRRCAQLAWEALAEALDGAAVAGPERS